MITAGDLYPPWHRQCLPPGRVGGWLFDGVGACQASRPEGTGEEAESRFALAADLFAGRKAWGSDVPEQRWRHAQTRQRSGGCRSCTWLWLDKAGGPAWR